MGMNNTVKILVVEDDRAIGNFLATLLTYNNYSHLRANSGREAISIILSHNPDLMLLDLGLPDMDGMNVLSRVREWSDMPIIVVSARQSEQEKVAALDNGANDYVTKPFGNNELLARIRTVLRQRDMVKNQRALQHSVFSAKGLRIDYDKRLVEVEGSAVHLTPIEYKIVALLAQNAGKVLTHDYLFRQVWGATGGDSQILRVNMANIRRKIEANPADPCYILTEMGVGYRMADVDA